MSDKKKRESLKRQILKKIIRQRVSDAKQEEDIRESLGPGQVAARKFTSGLTAGVSESKAAESRAAAVTAPPTFASRREVGADDPTFGRAPTERETAEQQRVLDVERRIGEEKFPGVAAGSEFAGQATQALVPIGGVVAAGVGPVIAGVKAVAGPALRSTAAIASKFSTTAAIGNRLLGMAARVSDPVAGEAAGAFIKSTNSATLKRALSGGLGKEAEELAIKTVQNGADNFARAASPVKQGLEKAKSLFKFDTELEKVIGTGAFRNIKGRPTISAEALKSADAAAKEVERITTQQRLDALFGGR